MSNISKTKSLIMSLLISYINWKIDDVCNINFVPCGSWRLLYAEKFVRRLVTFSLKSSFINQKKIDKTIEKTDNWLAKMFILVHLKISSGWQQKWYLIVATNILYFQYYFPVKHVIQVCSVKNRYSTYTYLAIYFA